MECLDAKIETVMFDHVLPHFVTPLVHDNLRRSFAMVHSDRTVSMQSLYRSYHASVQITPEKVAEFKRRALSAIEYEMPWWLPGRYFEAAVNDMAQQYVWYNHGATCTGVPACDRLRKPTPLPLGHG